MIDDDARSPALALQETVSRRATSTLSANDTTISGANTTGTPVGRRGGVLVNLRGTSFRHISVQAARGSIHLRNVTLDTISAALDSGYIELWTSRSVRLSTPTGGCFSAGHVERSTATQFLLFNRSRTSAGAVSTSLPGMTEALVSTISPRAVSVAVNVWNADSVQSANDLYEFETLSLAIPTASTAVSNTTTPTPTTGATATALAVTSLDPEFSTPLPPEFDPERVMGIKNAYDDVLNGGVNPAAVRLPPHLS